MKKLLFGPLFICFLFSCNPDPGSTLNAEIPGYVPVYASFEDISQITVENARPTAHAGKIYAFGSFIFQNDLNEGIHIIDNSDRNNPKKVAFLKVPLSTEIAVKGNFLYTNNLDDLVVFDISNASQPTLVNRVKKVFPQFNQDYPPFQNVYFECADPSKGIVVRWEQKNIKSPTCRR